MLKIILLNIISLDSIINMVLNCTGNRAMDDFQQSLNNSCFRGMKSKMFAFYQLQYKVFGGNIAFIKS